MFKGLFAFFWFIFVNWVKFKKKYLICKIIRRINNHTFILTKQEFVFSPNKQVIWSDFRSMKVDDLEIYILTWFL